jgi:hypothetical protein
MSIEWILESVRKTNPSMTKDKLIEELSKCRYSAVALCMVCENDKNILQNRKSMVH